MMTMAAARSEVRTARFARSATVEMIRAGYRLSARESDRRRDAAAPAAKLRANVGESFKSIQRQMGDGSASRLTPRCKRWRLAAELPGSNMRRRLSAPPHVSDQFAVIVAVLL